LFLALAGSLALSAAAQEPRPARGVEILTPSAAPGAPVLCVDGRPYFLHATVFPYYRVPRDLWESSLDRYRTLGINTIELVVPWNWHQPAPEEPDFDGRTNPRRDLRALLKLVADRGFRLVVRTGPAADRDFRHGGYPEWLLDRTEARMSARDRLAGRLPPLAELSLRDPAAAARGWLSDAEHMSAARQWLEALARELLPWTATRTILVPAPASERPRPDAPQQAEAGGPLILVQVEEVAVPGAAAEYAEALAEVLRRAGLDVPIVVRAGEGLVPPGSASLPARGEWFAPPPPPAGSTAEPRIGPSELASLAWAAERLNAQSEFPPLFAALAPGWAAPSDDARPAESRPENLLLASRLLLAHGAKGFVYWPLQDSLTPAGWSAPDVSRHYRWDAPLALSGEPQFRARIVERNAQMLAMWGEALAASRRRTDLAVVWSEPGTAGGSAATRGRRAAIQKLLRLSLLAGLSTGLVDPAREPVERLQTHPVILLPLAGEAAPLPEEAQRRLVEYVRGGGTLVWFPARPLAGPLAALWQSEPAAAGAPDAAVTAEWRFGAGRVFESTKDFFSWLNLQDPLAVARSAFESAWATGTLREFLTRADVAPAVRWPTLSPVADRLLATQLVSNAGASRAGEAATRGVTGLLSVTNLSYDEPAEETLSLLPPAASARDASAERIELRVSLPPRESLLLPLEQPLCSAAPATAECSDAVVAAGAELVRAERDGRNLLLTFYAPSRAQVFLRLAQQPRRVMLEEMRPAVEWNTKTNVLVFDVLRGAAPDFLRTVTIQLPYPPFVPERPEPGRKPPAGVARRFLDSVRLPLGEDASLPSEPPLFLLNEKLEGEATLALENLDDRGAGVELRAEGFVRGSRSGALGGRETNLLRVELKPEPGSLPDTAPDADGLYRGQMELRVRREPTALAAAYAVIRPETVTPYRFDFDRDGSVEWALEDRALRLVFSPEAGGQAVALVDKVTQTNLTTVAGAFLDGLAADGGVVADFSNRPYRAEWLTAGDAPAVRLTYAAPDSSPERVAVEKTFRIAGNDEIVADYSVALGGGGGAGAPVHFVTALSFPVLLRGPFTTEFCFDSAPGEGPEARENAEAASCSPFAPGGAPLDSPPAARGGGRLVLRTPGRLAVALDWPEGARVRVERKRYSAQVRVIFPPLTPDGEPARYSLRMKLLPAS
jgi:hypothetical protein